MLVLTRKQNEKIQIGDNIYLTVLRIKGNTVRLGIEAPQDVRVVRGELPPQTELPKVKEMTLMVTDPATGEIQQRWSQHAADRTPRVPRGTQSGKGASDLDSIDHEVNRLKQLVASVGRSSWGSNPHMAER